MDKQITAWEKESISEKGNVAQNLKEKIRANTEKLDKLVSVFLDGDIEREMYLQRKDLLMREKAGLLESETNFGQQRKDLFPYSPIMRYWVHANIKTTHKQTGHEGPHRRKPARV